MNTTGIFVGKFLPPHKGHIQSILEAKKHCTHLVVIVCFEPDVTKQLCKNAGIDFISLELKEKWIKSELKDCKDIEVLSLDETGIAKWPNGWEQWSERVKKLVNRPIDFIFGSELDYLDGYSKFFPSSKYVLLDPERKTVNISSTKIRADIKQNFEFIVDSAKPFFKKYI